VIDDQNAVVGIVTRGDIVRELAQRYTDAQTATVPASTAQVWIRRFGPSPPTYSPMASIDSIQTALQSEDFGDRLRGINQLREIDPAVAFELIQGSVSDRNTRVRYAAVSQISELGKQNPDQALEILKRALHQDPEADVQAAAADAIGALGLIAAYDDLARVYHSTS